jgi:hypothetical protein
MANSNTLQQSKLKSAFQGVVGSVYAALGENVNIGIETAGYVYDRAKYAKDQAVRGLKSKFS